MITDEMVEAALKAFAKDDGSGVSRGLRDWMRAAIAAALAVRQGEPVAWQWRRKGEPWRMEYTFSSKTYATTDDSEVRALYAHPAPAEPSAEVMDMALCESQSIVLRVGQTYRFRPVGDCEKCKAMAQAAHDAYGPNMGAPGHPLRYPHGSMGEEA
jgi:hypothetical protein